MVEITVEEIVTKAVECGLEVMGDDWIGYKFVGENSSHRNKQLAEIYSTEPEVVLNAEWFKILGISVLEYENGTWIAN